MGSRRRPPSRTNYAEEYVPGSSSLSRRRSVENEPSPFQKQKDRFLQLQDYYIYQKEASRYRKPVHPVLTDFGPESLRDFLQTQLNRLDLLATSIRNAQELQLRDWARTLANAPGKVSVVKEDGKRVLRLLTKQRLLKPGNGDDGDSPNEKGKTRAAAGKRQTRSNGKVAQIPQVDGLTATRKPGTTSRTQSQKVQTKSKTAPLTLLGFKETSRVSSEVPPVKTQHRSMRSQADQERSRDHEQCLPGSKSSSDDVVASSATRNDNSESKLPVSRTSSFENHVSLSRDTLRSNHNTSSYPENSAGNGRRRRKTPASLQASHQQNMQHGLYVENIRNVLHMLQDNQTIEDAVMTEAEHDYSLSEQNAILSSLKTNSTTVNAKARMDDLKETVLHYDYSQIVPENVPPDVKQAEINRCTIWKAHGLDTNGKRAAHNPQAQKCIVFTDNQLDPDRQNVLGAPNEAGDYPREYKPSSKLQEIHKGLLIDSTTPWRTSLPIEIWDADTGRTPGGVLHYLSSAEVRNLRLVCKGLAEDLGTYMFRSVVTKFGPSLFSLRPSYDELGRIKLDDSFSMLQRHGPEMNRFGITFECDMAGLMHAPSKVTETTVEAWFGRYTWPTKDYPYFPKLHNVDKLLDDERRILTQSMKSLTQCRELALSIDNAHGWLEGPDLSDMAIYRRKAHGAMKVFGKAFHAEDKAYENGLKELLDWAQRNTINENIKHIDTRTQQSRKEKERLRAIIIRDYDSYRQPHMQPDYEPHLHTGGIIGVDVQAQPPNPAMNIGAVLGGHPLTANPFHTALHGGGPPGSSTWARTRTRRQLQAQRQRLEAVLNIVNQNQASQGSSKPTTKAIDPIQPQWPLIFNGYNIAAEPRGDSNYVQVRVAKPAKHPVLPNCLTEAQVQWIMETSWIQRTFLSAYTDAVRMNAHTFRNVHSLHLAKISSGLLPMLSQTTFWTSLKSLRRITIIVKPDWKVEHIPGDKFFQSNMPTNVVNAAYKFFDLLKDSIAPLENLNSLHIGYTGGGEHQPGIFGRNQHVLPAPIALEPRAWLVAQNRTLAKPNQDTILVFPHVRTLTFENCWFSPLLLENFLIRSRDTSLHHLILDSVSLTAGINSSRTDGPLRTVENNLRCQHSPSAWLNEIVPANAAWVNLLDKVTPGKTILDHKYEANMIDEEEEPRPEPAFRGNIQQITLRSCGYVKVLGIPSNEFNQNELVFQNATWSAMDEGLKTRASTFHSEIPGDADYLNENEGTDDLPGHCNRAPSRFRDAVAPDNGGSAGSTRLTSGPLPRPIMLAGRAAHSKGESYFVNDDVARNVTLTGFLTQCIHPAEKRILERMWGLKFGWGDDMRRWEAVEDGWFMGGTGRFSGEVYKDPELQEAAALPIEDEENYRPIVGPGGYNRTRLRRSQNREMDTSSDEQSDTDNSVAEDDANTEVEDDNDQLTEPSDDDAADLIDLDQPATFVPPPPRPIPVSLATHNDTDDEELDTEE